MKPLPGEEERRREMVALYDRTHGPVPDKYQAIATWWRLYAEESRNPAECLTFAENQERLSEDMLRRPRHYRAKPANTTDYLWSQQ